MIKLSDGEILDLMPSQLNTDTDMACLSYALKMAWQRLEAYRTASMTESFIDGMPEYILDILAEEWRTQYYDQSLDIDTKRGLVKNTFIWHAKAGTASAVAELVRTVFGGGGVVEWPDFADGERVPGTFDVETGALMTQDMVERFRTIVDGVKNARSHLRRVTVRRDTAHTVRYGAAVRPAYRGENISQRDKVGHRLRYGAAIRSVSVGESIAQRKQIGQRTHTRAALYGVVVAPGIEQQEGEHR